MTIHPALLKIERDINRAIINKKETRGRKKKVRK